MSQLPAAPAPQQPGLDTLRVRGRLRGVWLALWLAGAGGCVVVGVYGDTPGPESTPLPGSHVWWLPLFLFLAAVAVGGAVRSFGRGLDADADGVVVRNMFRAFSIPWRDLAAIEFQGLGGGTGEPWKDPEVWDISGWYYKLVFQRQDGSRVTAEAPAGRGTGPGEYLFELRERLLAMRSAADEDQEGDREDSWPAYPAESHAQVAATDQPKRRSQTVRDWLGLAVFVVSVVLFGLPGFLILVLDLSAGDWLTVHLPFWDEVSGFYDWLWSYAE